MPLTGLLVIVQTAGLDLTTIGDRIVADDVEGDVIEIGARSTVVVTNDNIAIVVPSGKFITENVVNWKYNDGTVRFRIPVGVAFGNGVRLVERLLLEVATAEKKGRLTSALDFAIHDRFREHGIEIPFPQRDLHLRSGVLTVRRAE